MRRSKDFSVGNLDISRNSFTLIFTPQYGSSRSNALLICSSFLTTRAHASSLIVTLIKINYNNTLSLNNSLGVISIFVQYLENALVIYFDRSTNLCFPQEDNSVLRPTKSVPICGLKYFSV